jgi:hypothetical protein
MSDYLSLKSEINSWTLETDDKVILIFLKNIIFLILSMINTLKYSYLEKLNLLHNNF